MEFHQNQITTAEELLKKIKLSYYVVLAAEMQCGKTGTYLYLLLTMLYKNKIDYCYIITGNREVKLKTQCFFDKEKSVECFLKMKSGEITQELKNKLLYNVEILWGQDLHKSKLIPDNSLIIWDESHHAQKNMNKPFEFFKKNGIHTALFGDKGCLKSRNIYILSVSATPFAEIAANIRTSREEWEIPGDFEFELSEKTVLFMNTPDNYFGVYAYFQANCIYESFSLIEENYDKLKNLLLSFKDKKSYMIIRSSNDEDEFDDSSILYQVCMELSIPIEYDHHDKQSGLFMNEEYPYSGLKIQPSEFTIIHIKGKMRMGQYIYKKNICAVFESSKKPYLSSILQSLLGRVCGYINEDDFYDPRQIKIFIPESSIDMAKEYGICMKECNLNKLIMLLKKDKCINGKSKPPSTDVSGWYPIIPILISSLYFSEAGINAKNVNSTPKYLSKIMEIMEENNLLMDQNHLQRTEILSNFMNSGIGDGRNLVLDSYQNTYKLPKKFMDAYKQKKYWKSNQDNFIRQYTEKNPRQFQFFFIHETEQNKMSDWMKDLGFENGDGMIIGYTRNQTEDLKIKYDSQCPKIERTCDFNPLSICLEPDEISEDANGLQVLAAPSETYNDVKVFKKWLNDCLCRSKKNKEKNGIWSSTENTETGEYNYIVLKKVKFSRKKNGITILNSIITELSMKHVAKITVHEGPVSENNLLIKKITWVF